MTELILLHGFMGSPASWWPVREARGGLLAVALPLVGHGAEGEERFEAQGASSFEAEVDRLAHCVRSHPEERLHIVGYSLGARLALGLLVRHAELWRSGRVTGATLMGVHPGLDDEAERLARRRSDESWARRLENEPFSEVLESWRAQPVFKGLEERVSEELLARDLSERQRHDPRALARAMRRLSLGRMPDWTPYLPELELPVTLVVGELDARFRTLAEGMADRLPYSSVRVIVGAGHNLPLEAPDAVADLLTETLAGAPLQESGRRANRQRADPS